MLAETLINMTLPVGSEVVIKEKGSDDLRVTQKRYTVIGNYPHFVLCNYKGLYNRAITKNELYTLGYFG